MVLGLTFLNNLAFFQVVFTAKEIILFATALSCTEIFDLIPFIKPNNEPKIYSIIKGASIINYAVSIALFQSIHNYSEENGNIIE